MRMRTRSGRIWKQSVNASTPYPAVARTWKPSIERFFAISAELGGRPVGLARWIRPRAGRADEAEVALEVGDDWQGRGGFAGFRAALAGARVQVTSLGTPAAGAQSAEVLADRIRVLQDELRETKRRLKAGGGAGLPKPGDLLNRAEEVAPGVQLIAFAGPYESIDALKGAAKDLRGSFPSGVIALGLVLSGCTKCGWFWDDLRSSPQSCRSDIPK